MSRPSQHLGPLRLQIWTIPWTMATKVLCSLLSSRPRRSQIWTTPWTTAIQSLCCLNSNRTAARSSGVARGTTDARRPLRNGQSCQGVSRPHRPLREQPAVLTGLLRTCHWQPPRHRQEHLYAVLLMAIAQQAAVRQQAAARQQLRHHRNCRLRRVPRQAHLARRLRHRAQRSGSSSTRSAGPSSMRAPH